MQNLQVHKTPSLRTETRQGCGEGGREGGRGVGIKFGMGEVGGDGGGGSSSHKLRDKVVRLVVAR